MMKSTNGQTKKDISMATKKRMSKLLMFIGDQELTIEQARQNLCSCPSFEPYSGFKRIDRNGNGYITEYDILEFVK